MPSSSLFLRSSTTLVSALSLLSAPVLAAPALPGQVYSLNTSYSGSEFFDGWNFYDGADPTHGFVTYVSQSEAQAAGLISAGSSAKMLVDSQTVLPVPASRDVYWDRNGVGRRSVRIESQKSWTHGLFIADLNHMPSSSDAGCGTWPAFWAIGSGPWPNNGEVDIIEGANDQPANNAAGHTANVCTIDNRGGSGVPLYRNCNYNDIDPWGALKNPTGCQVASTSSQSYGAGFNSIGGGVYAMDWTTEAINFYFFPRGSIPADVNSANPNPSTWGIPFATIGGSGCNVENNFRDLRLVFDTTFCGDFGDATWGTGTCATRTGFGSCAAYVASSPGAFANAYWDINSVRVYQAAPAPVFSTTASSSSSAASTSSNTASTSLTTSSGSLTTASGSLTTASASSTTVTSSMTSSSGNYTYTGQPDPVKTWEDSNISVTKTGTDPEHTWEDSSAPVAPGKQGWQDNSINPAKPCHKCDHSDGANGAGQQWNDASGSNGADPKWQDAAGSSDPAHQWKDAPSANGPGQQWQDASGSSDPAHQWKDTPASSDPAHQWQDAAAGSAPAHGSWPDAPAPAGGANKPADPAAAWSDAAAPAAPSNTVAPANGAWSDAAAAPSKPVDPASAPAASWSDAAVVPAQVTTYTVIPQKTPVADANASNPAAETWADAPAAPSAAPVKPAGANGSGSDDKVSPYTGAAASSRSVVAYGVVAMAGLVGAFLL
ncbi:uncharacterized protein HMPREF1541_06463 [Cyphellophora europaea CBS 101466]|uniref:GH16 domain-containing protein n=1 Tax=Cyphellophora europaea (strain CBS 101466) TaxID=1220924 RepID=W2RRT0_CYPE1|nr:uncharacterized protein HMPREF1541_06463 [Cyphellophora europaea CBS 101466]ETN38428.1 hypothetical protein HMPREF1541_06463 [Cyphellophora europaea CBS 101466]